MTDLLERALERVQTLPSDMQDQAARILLAFAGEDQPVIELTPEEHADLLAAQEELARGDFATDEEVSAVLQKYRG